MNELSPPEAGELKMLANLRVVESCLRNLDKISDLHYKVSNRPAHILLVSSEIDFNHLVDAVKEETGATDDELDAAFLPALEHIQELDREAVVGRNLVDWREQIETALLALKWALEHED